MSKRLRLCALSIPLVASAAAATARPPEVLTPRHYLPATDHIACPDAKAVGDSEIITLAVGGNSGGQHASIAFDDANGPVYTLAVRGHLAKPTYLVLISYSSVVWDLSGITGRVTGAYVAGNAPGGIAGLPHGAPAAFWNRRFHGDSKEPEVHCFAVEEMVEEKADLESFGKLVHSMFGRYPAHAYATSWAGGFDLDSGRISQSGAVPDPRDIRSGRTIQTGGMRPGMQGVQQLVDAGLLFPVNPVVAYEMYDTGLLEGIPDTLVPPRRDSVFQSYFATKSFPTLPAELEGAQGIALILPKGVKVSDPQANHTNHFRYLGKDRPWKVPYIRDLTRINESRNPAVVGDPLSQATWAEDGAITRVK